MLRQFWFWFPGNCFLMDSALKIYFFIFLFFLVPNRCLHRSLIAILSLPQSLTCSLMNPPHPELWPRKIKRPFHQNIRDGKACSHSELVFHLCPTWPGGSVWGFWEDIWTLATVKMSSLQWLYCVYIPALLCLWSCSLLVDWWGLMAPIHFKAAFPRVCPSDGDLHFVF